MSLLADLVQQNTATPGTGTITLGSAVTGFRTLAASGIPDGSVVSYAILDGTNRETGTGVVGGSGTTLTRVLRSSSTGSLLNLSGSAVVAISPNAGDFELPNTIQDLARAAGPAIFEQFDHFLPTSVSNALGACNRGSFYTENGATFSTGAYIGGTTADSQTGVLAVRFAPNTSIQRPTLAFTDDRSTITAGNGITHIVASSIKIRPANAPTGPSATNDYFVSLGFGESSSDRTPSSLIKLDYYFNGTSIVFEARTRESGGSISTTSLSLPASDTYVTWAILVNGLNVEFWVGGVRVATRTLSANNLALRPMLLGNQTTAAAACGFDVDWSYIGIRGMTR